MEFNEFKEYVCNKVMNRLGAGYSYRIIPTLKNNGTILTGFSVTKGNDNISPTLYIEHFYEAYNNGCSLTELIGSMTEAFKRCTPEFDLDLEDIRAFEKVSDRLFLKVVNYTKNKTLAEDAPHIRMLDLCVLFYCLISDKDGESASTLIRNDLFESWNVSKEDLFDTALENTKKKYGIDILSMKQVIYDIVSSRFDNDEETDRILEGIDGDDLAPMYVITNRAKVYGASCILFTEELAKLAEKLESDLYILPCSIHELIAIPDYGDASADSLRDMVKEVNRTEVEEAEILSDNIYRFDRKGTCVYSVYSA